MFCRIFFWLNWVCRSIRSANEVLISFRLSVNLLAVSVSISFLPTLSFISLKTFLSKSSNEARAAFAAGNSDSTFKEFFDGFVGQIN